MIASSSTLLSAEDQVRTYDTRAIDAFMEGIDLEAAGKYEDALLAYQRAIVFDPNAGDIHFSLARLYLHLEKKHLAKES